jgi:hypothetical protein
MTGSLIEFVVFAMERSLRWDLRIVPQAPPAREFAFRFQADGSKVFGNSSIYGVSLADPT